VTEGKKKEKKESISKGTIAQRQPHLYLIDNKADELNDMT
jgi:hypothetical protein